MSDEHAAEVALLGALLIDPQLLVAEPPLVPELGIFSANGRALYEAIERCYERHKAVDAVLVMDGVPAADRERVSSLVAEALESCPMSKNARRYSDILSRGLTRSKVVAQSVALHRAIEENDAPARVKEHIEALETLVDQQASAAREAKPFDLREVVDEEDEPVPYVIDGWLAVRDFAVIGGEPGTGKSVFALDLGVALASGTDFLGKFKIDRQHTVVYLDEEMAPRLARRRLKQMIVGRKLEPDAVDLWYYNGNSLNFDSPDGRAVLRKILDRHRPQWLVLDSLVRFHRRNENDNSEMAQFCGMLKQVQEEFDCGIVALHHLAKPSKDRSKDLGHRLRGASDLRAVVDQLWGIEGDQGTDTRTLSHEKNRWGRHSSPVMMQWEEQGSSATLSGQDQGRVAEHMVLDLLTRMMEKGATRQACIKMLRNEYSEASAEKIATSVLGKLKKTGAVYTARSGREMHYWHKDHAPQGTFYEQEGN